MKHLLIAVIICFSPSVFSDDQKNVQNPSEFLGLFLKQADIVLNRSTFQSVKEAVEFSSSNTEWGVNTNVACGNKKCKKISTKIWLLKNCDSRESCNKRIKDGSAEPYEPYQLNQYDLGSFVTLDTKPDIVFSFNENDILVKIDLNYSYYIEATRSELRITK